MATKAEMRQQAAANHRRLMIVLVILAFATGLITGLLLPVLAIPLLSITMLVLGGFAVAAHLAKQKKPVRKLPVKRGVRNG